jgi:hypothetical protein
MILVVAVRQTQRTPNEEVELTSCNDVALLNHFVVQRMALRHRRLFLGHRSYPVRRCDADVSPAHRCNVDIAGRSIDSYFLPKTLSSVTGAYDR